MKNNKIKFLTLSICLPTSVAALSAIAACSKPEQVKYNVSINASDRYIFDATKVGENKAIKGQQFEVQFTFADNFKAEAEDIVVFVDNKIIDNFTFKNNKLTIDAKDVTGDIYIYVTPTVINLFNIDSVTHQLKGFRLGLRSKEISYTCKGTLTIPASVVTIAPSAFCTDLGEGPVSTIPDDVEKLVFEENIDAEYDKTTQKWTPFGYSSLSNTGEFIGIGEAAFKQAPFVSVQLPVGMGYTIGESAFEACPNLKNVYMPQPSYVTTEAESKTYGVDIGDWKVAACFKTAGFKQQWYSSHKVILQSKVFFDCKNLQYISFSLLTNFVNYSENHFTMLDEEENIIPSNATILDFSNYSQLRFYAVSDSQKTDAATKWNDSYSSASAIADPFGTFGVLANQFNIAATGLTPDKAVYCLMNDSYNEVGRAAEQNALNNNLLACFGCAPQSAAFANNGQFEQNGYLVRSHNNMCREIGAPQDGFDGFALASSTASISVNSEISERYQTINLTDPALAIKGLKGDFEYEITKAEWTSGKEVPLVLHHIKKEEFEPEAQQDAYLNNKFTVLWSSVNAPKAGDKVKLTFNITSLGALRETKDLELTISFTE